MTASDSDSGLHETETYCFMNCDDSSSYSTSSSYSQSGLAANFTPRVKDKVGNITVCDTVNFTKMYRYNSASGTCTGYQSGTAVTTYPSISASGYTYSSSSAATTACSNAIMSQCYNLAGSSGCQSCSNTCSSSYWISKS